MDDRLVEQRLRAALAARADQVAPEDLRPAQVPGTHTERGTAPRQRALIAIAVPVVLATVFLFGVGAWALRARSAPQGQAELATEPATPPLTVRVTAQTGTVSGTAAALTYPVPHASGGSAGVAQRVDTLFSDRVDSLVTAYRTQAANESLAQSSGYTLEITTGAVETWGRYLSVRLDEVADYGGVTPDNTSTALVVDTDSGTTVVAADLFTNVDAVDRQMRAALSQAIGSMVDTAELAQLSMRPGKDGSTTPLAWYPAADGLHWVVDRCAVAPCPLDQPAAVLPWSQLSTLTRPGTGP
ncbi:MAG TPA: hypothetical protein VJT31_06140 [Rugosimonospora sp.]|nr:hypothetical protein [Rugosimonospora sp.]